MISRFTITCKNILLGVYHNFLQHLLALWVFVLIYAKRLVGQVPVALCLQFMSRLCDFQIFAKFRTLKSRIFLSHE